jgi:hypothetical protein
MVTLVALLVVIGLIAIGTRISLYLYLQRAEETHRFTRRMPVADERSGSDSIYTVKRPRYRRVMDTEFASPRYAVRSVMVIALIFLLTVMAAVSILFGGVH